VFVNFSKLKHYSSDEPMNQKKEKKKKKTGKLRKKCPAKQENWNKSSGGKTC